MPTFDKIPRNRLEQWLKEIADGTAINVDDATAVASDVAYGKTFYAGDDNLKWGTFRNRGTIEIVPNISGEIILTIEPNKLYLFYGADNGIFNYWMDTTTEYTGGISSSQSIFINAYGAAYKIFLDGSNQYLFCSKATKIRMVTTSGYYYVVTL